MTDVLFEIAPALFVLSIVGAVVSAVMWIVVAHDMRRDNAAREEARRIIETFPDPGIEPVPSVTLDIETIPEGRETDHEVH